MGDAAKAGLNQKINMQRNVEGLVTVCNKKCGLQFESDSKANSIISVLLFDSGTMVVRFITLILLTNYRVQMKCQSKGEVIPALEMDWPQFQA